MLPLYTDNQITLLRGGEEYFSALDSALELATQTIYLESYIFTNGPIGRRVSGALIRAALRGVETHLMVDGYGSKNFSKTLAKSLEDAGVKMLVFRPRISPLTFRRMRLRRLHRKIVVVDRRLAFVGGININDEIGADGKRQPRYDYAVCVKGPMVKMIFHSSRRLWQRVATIRGFPAHPEKTNPAPPVCSDSAGSMRSTFLVRNNFRHRRDIENAYLQAIENAHSEILLVNAYFLPGLNFRHALSAAAERGVRVVLLLQGKMDHRLFQMASRALYGSFLSTGIEIFEYHKTTLHAKVAVIDDHWSTVGSSNLDPFSLLLALEANVMVDDPVFAASLKQNILQAIDEGAQQISVQSWKSQSFLFRFASWLSYGLVRLITGIAGSDSVNVEHKSKRG